MLASNNKFHFKAQFIIQVSVKIKRLKYSLFIDPVFYFKVLNILYFRRYFFFSILRDLRSY